MSPPKEEVAVPLLAKQNPETGAKLLRRLSRAQLHLWQEIGRRGINLSDLEIRHAGRDMLQEVQQLEEFGVVLLEELSADQAREAFSAAGEAAAAEVEKEDPRVRRGAGKGRARPGRSTAAVEKSSLSSARQQRPTEGAETQARQQRPTEGAKTQARQQRPTEGAETQARQQRPTEGAETQALAGRDTLGSNDATEEVHAAPEAEPTPPPPVAIEMPARNPKSQRKHARASQSPIPEIKKKIDLDNPFIEKTIPTASVEAKDAIDNPFIEKTIPTASVEAKDAIDNPFIEKTIPTTSVEAKDAIDNPFIEKTVPTAPSEEDTAKDIPVAARKRTARPSAAIEKPARASSVEDETAPATPVAARKRTARPSAAIEKHAKASSVEDETAEAKPATARRRTARPSAAIEKPAKPGKRKPPPPSEDETAEAKPATARRRTARPSAAIEKPTRASKRDRVRRPSKGQDEGAQASAASAQDSGASARDSDARSREPGVQTEPLSEWKATASTRIGRDEVPLGLDPDALKEWAARGTKAQTKPGMPDTQQRTRATQEEPSRGADNNSFFSDNSISIGEPAGAGPMPTDTALELGGDGFTQEETALMKLDVDLSVEEKKRILEVARAVKSGDICGLLGLEGTAKRKAIKRAYYTLSQELHPDQYFGRNLGGFKPVLEAAFTSLAQYVKALNDKRTTLPSSFRESNKARRKSQRFHIHLRAQVKCKSWEQPEWTVIQDISDGGTFLITDVPAVLGETILINVESPNGTIGIAGKVVSMREGDQARRQRRNGGLGIQFENAQAVDYQRLKDLLAEAKKHTPAFTSSAPVKSLAAQKLAKSSRAIHRQKNIIGIDLGTTNTAVSAVIDNRVQIVPWPDGSYSMPSVVSFPERGRCVTGYEAQRHLMTDPRNVINSGKRLVGRQFDDPEIASFMADARFKNYKGPDGTIIAKLWGEDYAIPQICSYLFSAAKHAATKTLGKEPTQAVLTVPVSFESGQIEAMRLAAKLAQLEVVEVIEEPCAAAVANQGQKDFKGIVGVYDFGGGTFDFSLVEAGAGDMQILATTGDSWLGGDDFDLAIADAAANMFWKAEGTDLRQKAVEWQLLMYACEQAKRELSRKERAQVVVPDVTRNAHGPVDLRINLTRSKVELLWAEPIGRSIDTCKQALSLAGVPMSKLSAIYLSGGTSYIPAIRRALMRSFGVPVHLGLAPEHAVCAGAGIRAAILQGA